MKGLLVGVMFVGVSLVLWSTESRPALSVSKVMEFLEEDIQYEPAEIQIGPGQTVRITNTDPFFHMTKISRLAEDGTETLVVFGPHVEMPDTNVDVRLPEAGRYKLRCMIHDGMTAILHVKG